MNQPAAPEGQQPQQEMIQRGASDLHITVGDPVMIRVDGDLTKSKSRQVLTPKDTLSLSYSILTENQKILKLMETS